MNPLRIVLQWDITQEIIKSQGCGALAKLATLLRASRHMYRSHHTHHMIASHRMHQSHHIYHIDEVK
jgi:hypothetical protein